jgi:general L-amino acid transport system substrate-binding protein
MRRLFFCFILSLPIWLPSPAQAAILDEVRERGQVRCGVHTGIAGFASQDTSGIWRGLDADFCRAVAAAVLGDAKRVQFFPVSVKDGIEHLQSAKVDLLARNLTQTLKRDTLEGLTFAGINYYDGQGLLVRKSLGARTIRNLNDAAICVQPASTSERNLEDFMQGLKVGYRKVSVANAQEMVAAYLGGRCDVMTSDYTQLAILKQTSLSNPDEHVLFRERLSKEPLGPLVRKGDEGWFKIVKWTLYALMAAEEMEITQANADEKRKSTMNNVRRFMGVEPGLGKALGLSDQWAFDIIRQVGNYGESFERNLGKGSVIGIERGLNELWTKGGLMYAPPFQ